MFFDSLVEALEQLQAREACRLADESRKLCRAVFLKVLTKVAYMNPGINFSNVFERLPQDADLAALEALVMPIVDKVGQVKRIEGQRRDQLPHSSSVVVPSI